MNVILYLSIYGRHLADFTESGPKDPTDVIFRVPFDADFMGGPTTDSAIHLLMLRPYTRLQVFAEGGMTDADSVGRILWVRGPDARKGASDPKRYGFLKPTILAAWQKCAKPISMLELAQKIAANR
jgi:hypothetical protein